MKSKIVLLIALTVSLFTTAQTKVGTINSELIIGKMPQMQTVLKRVENYGKKLDSGFQIKAVDYQAKVEAYKASEKTMTAADKQTKINELATIENEMANFRQNGAKLLQLRRSEFMRPLYKKVSETISEIAKANGYTQILTTSGNEFGYIDERFDITQQVLDKLGIKE